MYVYFCTRIVIILILKVILQPVYIVIRREIRDEIEDNRFTK